MQELISKNPIQRYKQGKQVIKTSAPVKETVGHYVREKNRSLFGSGWRWYDIYAPAGRSHVALDQEVEQDGWILNPNGSKKRKVTIIKQKTNPNSNQKNIVKESQVTKKSQQTISEEPKKLKTQSSNVSKKQIPISTDNHYIATIGNVNRYNNIVSQLGLTNRDAVRKFQMEKLGLIGDAADGIWGRDTQAAYDNYINNKANITNAAQIIPSVINFANPSINIPNTIKVGSDNAANTKAFTDRLYNNTKIFKNGGLVSNNPIKRFKQGGIQKFQNAGNLPTAPKAKDRYAEGKRQSAITKGGRYGGRDKIEIKQVVGKKPGIFGSSPIIRQMVLHSTVSPSYNDTTYLEIPERKNPLVERKLRGIEKHPSVFKTYYSNVYPFFGDILPDLGSGTKEEYETLKRRFNTAWNLAK